MKEKRMVNDVWIVGKVISRPAEVVGMEILFNFVNFCDSVKLMKLTFQCLGTKKKEM